MDDPAYVKANSPIENVDKFNVPVLIIHGEDDQRVPIQNAREMKDALQKKGVPVEFLTKGGEGHGFFSEAHNTERLERIEKFLSKYIGASQPD